jgi:DNA-binding NarL/FixJ family response regulator
MTDTGTPMRVLLVDDQELVRAGFRMILSVESEIEVVGEAANGERAVELAVELRPDVVLMDVQMPGLDGIAATQRIVSAGVGKVVILTTFDRDDYLFESLGAGASGFLLKNTAPEDLVEAIQVVHSGHALLAPEVTRRVIKRFTGGGERVYRPDLVAVLTEREREVLGLIARGLTNTEIANQLFVGEATVKTHVSRVLLKLGLRDRVQAVVFAYECGLVIPGDEHTSGH